MKARGARSFDHIERGYRVSRRKYTPMERILASLGAIANLLQRVKFRNIWRTRNPEEVLITLAVLKCTFRGSIKT